MLAIPYFLGLLFSFLAGASKNHKKIFLMALFFVLGIFLAFRGLYVGTDTDAYYVIFEKISNGEAVRQEPVFAILGKFFSHFSNDAFLYLAFLAFSSLFFILSTSLKYSKSFFLTFVMFMALAHYFYFFNIVRQGVAISILVFSVRFILERRFLYFAISVVLASGFHYAALIFLPAYVLVERRCLTFLVAWVFSLVFVINSSAIQVFSYAGSYLVSDYYMKYFIFGNVDSSYSVRFVFYQLVFLLLLIAVSKKRFSASVSNLTFANLSMFGVIVGNYLFHSGWLSRVADFYQIFIIFSLPAVIFYFFSGISKILISLLVTIFFTMFYFRLIDIGSHGVSPYYFFWS